MAKKASNSRGKVRTKKSNILAIFLVVAAAILIGAGAMWLRGGEKAQHPAPPRTAGNRLVVMEFADFG